MQQTELATCYQQTFSFVLFICVIDWL